MIRRAPVVLPGGREWVDAVIGIRTWRAHPDHGLIRLGSVYGDHLWPHRDVFKAECLCRGSGGDTRQDGSKIPGACKGTCGIYSWSEDLQSTEAVPVAHWTVSKLFVHGEVYLWGKVRRHERGYKADYAMPAGFYLPPKTSANYATAVLAAEQWDLPLLSMPLLPSPSMQRTTPTPCRHGAGCYRCVGGSFVKKDIPDDAMDALMYGISAHDIAKKNIKRYRDAR